MESELAVDLSAGGGGTCDSAFFPSNGHSYTHVCGKIVGYQKGVPDAFARSIVPGLEGPCIARWCLSGMST